MEQRAARRPSKQYNSIAVSTLPPRGLRMLATSRLHLAHGGGDRQTFCLETEESPLPRVPPDAEEAARPTPARSETSSRWRRKQPERLPHNMSASFEKEANLARTANQVASFQASTPYLIWRREQAEACGESVQDALADWSSLGLHARRKHACTSFQPAQRTCLCRPARAAGA